MLFEITSYQIFTMMETIRFSTNWNGKLYNRCFTAIRIANPKYKKGNHYIIEASIKDFQSFEVECLLLLRFKANDLPELCCYLDTGYSKAETIQIFSKMYPSNFETLDFFVILLKRLK
jgi:hypothetical protein